MTRLDAKNLALDNISKRSLRQQLEQVQKVKELLAFQSQAREDCLEDMARYRKQADKARKILVGVTSGVFAGCCALVLYGLLFRRS